jgi:hypothetical protein
VWPVKKRMGEKKGGAVATGDALYNGAMGGEGAAVRCHATGLVEGPGAARVAAAGRQEPGHGSNRRAARAAAQDRGEGDTDRWSPQP